MNALGDLIDTVKDINGWSDPDLSRNAQRKGFVLSKSNVSRYRVEDPMLSISASAIKTLAAALDVPEARVASAALQSMQIDASAGAIFPIPTVETAVRHDLSLSARDRELLLALLERMRIDADDPRARQTHDAGAGRSSEDGSGT